MKAWSIILLIAVSLVDLTMSHAGQFIGTASFYPGPTPFISFVQLKVSDAATLKHVQIQTAPKTGSATRPIKVQYSRRCLQERGYLESATGQLTLPVFGLDAGWRNSVSVTGVILDVDTTKFTESVNIEVEAAGNLLKT
jgi:hypothetical protein